MMDLETLKSNMQYEDNFTAIRFILHGEDATNGQIGILDASQSLLGFQKLFQEIAGYYEPAIKHPDFNLPVSLSKGSLITELLKYWWLAPSLRWFLKTLLKEPVEATGHAIAELLPWNKEKDFNKKMEKIPFLIHRILTIAKFAGGIGEKATENLVVSLTHNQNLRLKNNSEEELIITPEEWDLFKSCDPHICSQLVAPIRPTLHASYSYVDENQVENSILITEQDKEYLYFPEDEDDNEPDIVLPELEDGHYYELEGKINRVTEKTCSLGFFYKGHTITSIPVDKQLATYKNSFLSKRSNQVLARVRISGIIERKDSSSGFMRNRPVMNFDKLELLDDEYEEGELF